MESSLEVLRACRWCGSLWGKVDLLCSRCWLKIEKSMPGQLSELSYPMTTYSLLTWDKKETRSLKSEMLLNLKGGAYTKTVQNLAWNFLRRYPEPLLKDLAFVPAPAKNYREKDHAYVWGENLATITGGQISLELKRESGEEQKKKKLQGRQESQFIKVGEGFYREKKVILVDDIIASGSTALAAYRALGEPKFFQVWTIAHRPKVLD